jgi:L-iditol 2-dehydrogenase
MVIEAGITSHDRMTFTASVSRHRSLTIRLVRCVNHTCPRAIRLVETGLVDVELTATQLVPLERNAKALDQVAAYEDGLIRAVVQVST